MLHNCSREAWDGASFPKAAPHHPNSRTVRQGSYKREGDFPGGPVIKTVFSMQRAWV